MLTANPSLLLVEINESTTANILSPKKLREKYDQLYLKMIEENNKNQSAKYNFLSVSNDRDKYYR